MYWHVMCAWMLIVCFAFFLEFFTKRVQEKA